MDFYKNYLQALVNKGGPEKEDYFSLNCTLQEISEDYKKGILTTEDISEINFFFGDAFSQKTTQGFAYVKPHGYAGDFEIIDRIYNKYNSEDRQIKKWDVYWQNHAAAKAVRNRITYFEDLIVRHLHYKKN